MASAAPPPANMRPPVVHRLVATAGAARAGALGPLPTPGALLQTAYGQPLHMMREMLGRLPAEATAAAGVRYPQLWDQDRVMARTGRDVADYCCLQGRLAVLTLRDPARFPAPQATDAAVSVDTWGGRRKVAPAEYAAALARMRPDLAVSLCDEVGTGAGNNRTRAGIDRSLRWLDECAAALLGEAPPAGAADEGGGGGGGKKSKKDKQQQQLPPPPPSPPATEPAAKVPRLDSSTGPSSSAAAAAAAAPVSAPGPVPTRLLAYVPVVTGADPAAAAQRARVTDDVVRRVAAINARAAAAPASVTGGAPLVVGYVLGGLGLGEAPGDRLAAVADVCARLPPDGVRLAPGVGLPSEVLDLVAAGVDVVDADYAALLTQYGYAACFRYDDTQPEAAGGVGAGAAFADNDDDSGDASGGAGALPAPYAFQRPRVGSTDGEDAAARAQRLAQLGGDPSSSSSSSPASPPLLLGDATKLQLRDKAYARDTRPLVPGCPCFACAGAPPAAFDGLASGRAAGNEPLAAARPVAAPGHSRAYVHHLLACHEMLGDVLLSVHNSAHVAGFMGAVRRAVAAGDLAAYASWFRRVNGLPGADGATSASS
jgi:queuine tRNA-ribosyltransferase accessory subunit